MQNQKKETEHYSMMPLLWNIAGFKKSVIEKCKVDKYHAAVIGALLLMVGIYATLAWTFFFQTVTKNPILPVIGGIFMGTFIVCFDRALIASMASGKANIFSLGFRMLLAILLGIFLSQPMILKLYAPEIKREAQIILDKKIAERKQELTLVYANELNSLESQKLELQNQLDNKQKEIGQAEKDFKKEMDGSGGTGRWGYNTVSKQKEKILNNHLEEFDRISATNQPQITELQGKITAINDQIYNEVESYKSSNKEYGTLIQAEALESLMNKDASGSLRMRFYLLSFILTLIELSALIAKMFLRTSSYRTKIDLLNEIETTKADVKREILLSKLRQYKELSLQNEMELTEGFFKGSKQVGEEKLEELISDWKNSKELSIRNYWSRFRKILQLHS